MIQKSAPRPELTPNGTLRRSVVAASFRARLAQEARRVAPKAGAGVSNGRVQPKRDFAKASNAGNAAVQARMTRSRDAALQRKAAAPRAASGGGTKPPGGSGGKSAVSAPPAPPSGGSLKAQFNKAAKAGALRAQFQKQATAKGASIDKKGIGSVAKRAAAPFKDGAGANVKLLKLKGDKQYLQANLLSVRVAKSRQVLAQSPGYKPKPSTAARSTLKTLTGSDFKKQNVTSKIFQNRDQKLPKMTRDGHPILYREYYTKPKIGSFQQTARVQNGQLRVNIGRKDLKELNALRQGNNRIVVGFKMPKGQPITDAVAKAYVPRTKDMVSARYTDSHYKGKYADMSW